MKKLKELIVEKLKINKNIGKDILCNSISELSDKYDFDLISSGIDKKSFEGKQFNLKEYKVSDKIFHVNIGNKLTILDHQEIKQYANNLNYHFKDTLDNKYTITLANFNHYDSGWGAIRITDKNNETIAKVLYDYIKSTIQFKILKDEKEVEKILSNVLDYIINSN